MTFLITALAAEARPLIDHFGLRGSDASMPFRTYRSDTMTLVVSGVGRVASAAATAYAFAGTGSPRNRPWINVGIAGHCDVEVGSCRLASKISETSGRCWYPSLVFDPGMQTAEVITVDAPESGFERDALYDMEASAFFSTAARFAPVELVQVFKVVSDNKSSPAERLSAAEVSDLIAAHTEAISVLVRCTEALADRLGERSLPAPDVSSWTETSHFTRSQVRRLEDLLRRLQVVEEASLADLEEEQRAGDAGQVLRALEARLRRRGVGF